MTPWRWPRPRYALYEAPEVAAIDALGIVVEMTTALLETACPELRHGQTLPWESPRLHLAQAVLSHAQGLSVALERYREAVGIQLAVRDLDDPPF